MLTKRINFFIFLFVLLVIAGSDTLTELVYQNPYFAKVIFFNTLFFLLLPIYLFRNKVMGYFIYLCIPFILLIGKYFSYFVFHVPFEDRTILMVINTSSNETRELLRNYFVQLLLLISFYVFTIILFYKARPKTISPTISKYISIGAFILLLLMPYFFPYIKLHGNYIENFKKEVVSSYPGNFIKLSRDVWNQFYIVSATEKKRKAYKFNAVQDSVGYQDQIHVIIIGESSRYSSWGINGYSRNTSPNLSKRENLISLSNATAEGYITELSVPLLLTGVGPENYDDHFLKKSIVGVFDELGFSTYWLSNQLDRGGITAHAYEAKSKFFMMSQEHEGAKTNITQNMDMMLVDKLKSVLNEPGKNKFIVLHTLGSHFDYSLRYPDSFDVFKPSYKTVSAIPDDTAHINVLVNSYDNSILYADAIIDSVISLVASKNALSSVSYISDHGENLMDNEHQLVYHGYPKPSKYVAHIPFFVWYSPKLAAQFPDKIIHLVQNKNAPIASSNFIATVTNLVGIRSPKIDSTKSVSNSHFKPVQRHILGSKQIFNVDSLNN